MAQIIKLRRGTLAELNSVTLQNGELGVVTGSAAIGDSALKTAIVAGHSDGTNRLTVGRLITGNATPDLSGHTGGSAFNDMMYHETDAKTLLKLNTGGNSNLDLTGNIKDRTIGGTLNITGVVSASSNLYVGGDIHAVGDITFESGTSGTIKLGDASGDNLVIGADISSSMVPDVDDAFDLGSSSQQWKDLYLDGVAYIDTLGSDGDPSTAYIGGGEIDSTVIGGETPAAATVTTLSATGDVDLGDVTSDTITATARFDSNLVPSSDSARDLGTSALYWKDAYIDSVTTTGNVTVGGNITATGDLTINGTTTTIDSTTLNIGDNVVVLNTAGATADGGIQVIDAISTSHTGSMLWNATSDYWYSGISGSTHYRVPQQAGGSDLTENKPVIVDGSGRLESSTAITDDGSTVDVSNRLDAQASLQVTGSVYVSTGASVAASSASLISFRNDSDTQVGFLASSDTQAVTTGVVAYNASTGNLTVSSVVDGGSF